MPESYEANMDGRSGGQEDRLTLDFYTRLLKGKANFSLKKTTVPEKNHTMCTSTRFQKFITAKTSVNYPYKTALLIDYNTRCLKRMIK